MEENVYAEHICGRFCSFYRPGKKILQCGSFRFLRENLSPGELRQAAESTAPGYDLSGDEGVNELVCSRCDFTVDGCDFYQGLDSPPCGGYAIVGRLLRGA
jgi:hypothetical protein